MNNLINLPRYTQITPHITTVLGMNPSKMTLQGTNTYLFGRSLSRLLVDTGSGSLAYRANLTGLFYASNVDSLSHVLFTHYHQDHVSGISDVFAALYYAELARTETEEDHSVVLDRLLSKLPVLSKINTSFELPKVHVTFPSFPDAVYFEELQQVDAGCASSLSKKSHKKAESIRFDIPVTNLEPHSVYKYIDGQYILQNKNMSSSISNNDVTSLLDIDDILAIATPGHTSDHCSFLTKLSSNGMIPFKHSPEDIEYTQASYNYGLVSGDCILGHGTSAITDLHTYMQSLDLCLDIVKDVKCCQLPAHGVIGADASVKIKEYQHHRMQRVKQVEYVLHYNTLQGYFDQQDSVSPNARNQEWRTCEEIVRIVYSSLPEKLFYAAAQNTMLVLQMLVSSKAAITIIPELPLELAHSSASSPHTSTGTCRDCDAIEVNQYNERFQYMVRHQRFKLVKLHYNPTL